MEFPILVRGHFKDTVERFDIETLFIIIERYVKLYIFDCVEIVHDRAMAICVIALNRDVSTVVPRPLSNDPRLFQCIYRYSHASKHFVEV